MALQLVEIWKSGNIEGGRSPRRKRTYLTISPTPAADNADDPDTTYNFVAANAPATWGFSSAPGSTQQLQLVQVGQGERIAPGVFQYDCEYVSEGEFRSSYQHALSFNTIGGSQHITCSLAHIQTYNASGGLVTTPQDGLLNCAPDGNVSGIDIDVAAYNFQIVMYVPPTVVEAGYIDLLNQLTDTVNANTFTITIDGVILNFAPGSARFLGAQGSIRAYGDWEITGNFSVLLNADGDQLPKITVGGISGITKRGWDYLSIQYAAAADGTNNFLANTPAFAFVDQVYRYQNWSGLIPT